VIAEFPNHPLGVIPPSTGVGCEVDRSNPLQSDSGLGAHELGEDQMTRLSFYTSFMGMAAAVSPLTGTARRCARDHTATVHGYGRLGGLRDDARATSARRPGPVASGGDEPTPDSPASRRGCRS